MGELGIGQMAELNCVSKKALRLYQEKGLLEPIRVDKENGYRFYSFDQCATIDMIQQMEDLGISLDEIKHILDGKDPAQLAALLAEKTARIDAEMLRLSIARHNAAQLLDTYQTFSNGPICDQVVLEHIHERPIMTFDIFNPAARDLVDDAEVFLGEWELNLRLTKRYMREHDIPISLFHHIGCRIAHDDLVAHAYRFCSSFILLDDPTIAQAYSNDVMPAGYYLTMYKRCYIGPDQRNEEYAGIGAVLDYAAAHGFTACGDYFGEIIAETPAFLYEGRDMYFKLQVPITASR